MLILYVPFVIVFPFPWFSETGALSLRTSKCRDSAVELFVRADHVSHQVFPVLKSIITVALTTFVVFLPIQSVSFIPGPRLKGCCTVLTLNLVCHVLIDRIR